MINNEQRPIIVPQVVIIFLPIRVIIAAVKIVKNICNFRLNAYNSKLSWRLPFVILNYDHVMLQVLAEFLKACRCSSEPP